MNEKRKEKTKKKTDFHLANLNFLACKCKCKGIFCFNPGISLISFFHLTEDCYETNLMYVINEPLNKLLLMNRKETRISEQ